MKAISGRFTKRNLIHLSFLTAAFLLLAGLTLLVNFFYRQQKDQAWVAHTEQVIDQLKFVEARLVDAETSVRGYLVTGDTAFLPPYRRALPQLVSTLRSLPRLVADNPAQLRKVHQLHRLVSNKLVTVNRLIRPTASPRALLSVGRYQMDAVRQQVSLLIRVEQNLLRSRQQALQADYGVTSRLVWASIALALLNGAWSYWLIGREFSRRQEAEQRLDSSQQRYRSLVEHLKVVVFQTDASGRWTYLNPVWETVTGFPVAASLGGHVIDSVLGEDHFLARQLLEPQFVVDSPATKPPLLRFHHQTGGYRWFELLLEVTRNAQQQVVGWTGTLTDRTEAQRAQEALFESEQRFRAIADNVEEIFWVRDVHQPLFQYINPSFERYTGLSPETVYAHPLAFAQAVVEEDRPLVLEAFLSPQPRDAFRFRVQHPDGQLRWLSSRIFTEKNQAGQLTRRMGMATDITAVVEKEQLLEASLAAERSLNALKSQFIATASHQFRTPLTAIKLSVNLIQRYAHPTRETVSMAKIQKQVDTINRQVMALTELINDTLTLSRIEAGQLRVELAEADIVALSAEVVGLFGNREDGRQVAFTVRGQPVEVVVDKKLLSHVLVNLLSNAFKYSASDPQLAIVYASHQVRVTVSDRGMGIPQGDLPYLFSKFFRASNAGDIPGTGLGLAICQEYITLQQGQIEVESREGEGTVFTVIFNLVAT